MKAPLKIIFIVLFIIPLTSLMTYGATPSPEEIIAKADEIRSPQMDYTVDVTVTSIKPDGGKKAAQYEVLVKGKEKTIIKTLSPDMERGRTLLMLGNDLWVFLPDVSKPIRISLQQRLIGEVANGDIARVNFSGDYTPMLLRTDELDGKKYYVLELQAETEEVTYNKVIYWVRTDNYDPLKAEFYTISGRLIKTCSYEDYKELAGRNRPARLVLKDPLIKDQMSIIEYSDMKVTNLPEKYFTKDYMKKLKY